MQKDIMSLLSSSSPDIDQSVEAISRGFNQQFDLNREEEDDDDDSKLSPDLHVADEEHDNNYNNDDDHHEDDDDDDNFTFMLLGDDESPIDGPVFPLFDQKLLLSGEYEVEEIIDTLPVQPPVDNIFIHSPRRFPVKERGESNDETTGDYCAWSKKSDSDMAELSKKSNSTGFSKLWRLKEKGGRSNSYGRDAFVFFRSNDRKTTEATTSKGYVAEDKSYVRKTMEANTSKGYLAEDVNVAKGKARVVKKAKKSNVSAHEAYLKSKEEERKRSYLPYRPELMGFFTNVHGGLTKNVHPY